MIGDPFTIRCIVVCVMLFVILGLLAYALIDAYEDWRHWHRVWKAREAKMEETNGKDDRDDRDDRAPHEDRKAEDRQ